jgi:predicted CoA-substrate-specific enzyme activase
MSEHEYASVNQELDWKKAKRITAGVDAGAATTKAVILLDGEPYAVSVVTTRVPKESALKAMKAALAKTDLPMEKIRYIVGTGRGRKQVEFAHKTVSEIVAAALGAVHVWGPSVRTVLDAGGQSCRVIQCTEKGKATSFLWNDKCAAGIGRSMESFAEIAGKDLNEMSDIALGADKCPQLSDYCSVYAQSEALDLLRSKVPADEIIAGYHHAMVKRISTLVSRLGANKDFVVIGGLAKNQALMAPLEERLKIGRLAPKPEWDPAVVVALGAALIADAFQREAAA